jgi:tetratricopeptide (TPR) repeat protein
MREIGPSDTTTMIATADVRSPGTNAMVSSRIRCLAAFIVVAAAHLAPAAQSPSTRATDLYQRALELERHGNGPAALTMLWEAAGLDPTRGDIQNALGAALERAGALDAAADAYRAAATSKPAAAGADRNFVLVLVKAGRSIEAIARAKAGTEEAPGDADRWFTLGLAQADVDVDGAIDSFHHALALNPRHGLAEYNLALVLYRTDHVDAAVDALHAAAALQARPEISYTLGTIYWHEGDLDRAVKALTDATTATPDYADALLLLGTVLNARGDTHGSASALERAIRLRPDLPAPHIVLAQTLTKAGDDAGARRESAEAERLRALSETTRAAAALTAAGVQHLSAGDTPAAADCFRRAIRAFEPFAPAHYQLGRALETLGQHDAARAEFARAQQLNPALVPPR